MMFYNPFHPESVLYDSDMFMDAVLSCYVMKCRAKQNVGRRMRRKTKALSELFEDKTMHVLWVQENKHMFVLDRVNMLGRMHKDLQINCTTFADIISTS